MHTLYARSGWGSVLIEAQLAWYGLRYRIEQVGDLFNDPASVRALQTVNKLPQLPTLVLPDGMVMTESAAITLHLAEATGRHDLVPPPPRPHFLRWLVFIVANIYPTFTYADDPSRFVTDASAQADFKSNVDAYSQRLWRMVEAEADEPCFLGERFSALDLFVAVMTRWRPSRAWFAAETPKLHAIALRTEERPEIAAVWARNFPPEAA